MMKATSITEKDKSGRDITVQLVSFDKGMIMNLLPFWIKGNVLYGTE